MLYGFKFLDLPADTPTRIRASKAGYQSVELTVYPRTVIWHDNMALFVLPTRQRFYSALRDL